MASDLISREALKDELEKRFCVHCGVPLRGAPCGGCIVEAISENIKHFPAVDAEPVRHGRWMLEGAGWKRATFDGYMNCPNCYERFMRIVGTKLFNRCPECGCVMDGGKQDAEP